MHPHAVRKESFACALRVRARSFLLFYTKSTLPPHSVRTVLAMEDDTAS